MYCYEIKKILHRPWYIICKINLGCEFLIGNSLLILWSILSVIISAGEFYNVNESYIIRGLKFQI